ncbi:hypothetical protein AB0E59_17765 [Lentzea sp. NPDC034063]|uniref:hypothetical protein n=1 Tax=unclassified Lentzea TaxID=2643253 RepID=UPI0033E49F58
MVYDETDGGAYHDVGDHDPTPVYEPAQLPTQEVRSQIVKLGSQIGWNPERVQKALKIENNEDVSLNDIRYVLRTEKPN